MASGGLSRQRSTSDRRKDLMVSTFPRGTPSAPNATFEPCASTESIFLYAQGSDVVCLHHDSLSVERRFQKHTDRIQLIAVDNVSETGAGRLVVTYDTQQTAIVWDLFTGDQISRFASYEPLKVAAWMRNGNIAFGNGKGEVILFEPSTSEHVSARTIFDPITAIAPASDCKNYAIGYNNGSILLAALQPSFTILHTLTTSRAPSPITSLSWHASSSKQKSDMLATQTADGDLRVWSVSKPPTTELPRVIRVLKRPEPNFLPGRTWLAWSRNGRIIQYSEDETWSWDVRTKHVTYDTLPVLHGIRGIAAYGPNATLFSLGPDFTVRQYDAEQCRITANIRHAPSNILPTPPEDNQLGWTTSGSEDSSGHSPIAQSKRAMVDRSRVLSPQSYNSNAVSLQSRASKHSIPSRRDVVSPGQQSEMTGTTFSVGAAPSYIHDYSKSPQSSRTQPKKSSRLRQQVILSPQERPVDDLFPFTRARLDEVPYKPPRKLSDSEMTPDNLRRQMLQVVFGWAEDIQDMIRDEMSRHAPDSQHAIFLSRWLDEDDEYLSEVMGSTSVLSSMDWMLLALGAIDHSATARRITQVFIEKMLSRGDVHAAATMLLALGNHSDAIEVYVSRSQFMEAVILTCLVTPSDWQRQSHLVRKWGEHVVGNSQQQFARRCFSCSGDEPTEPWTSPSVAQMSSQNLSSQNLSHALAYIPENPISEEVPRDFENIYARNLDRRRGLDAPTPVAMPAPPTPFRAALSQNTRVTPQTSALKLVTDFGASEVPQEYRFPGLKSADYTPTAGATVTPIAESAIDRSALSPGGAGSYRQNNIRSLNAAMSARGVSTNHKHRLPSIGETPIDVEGPSFKRSPPPPLPNNQLATPADSSSERGQDSGENERSNGPDQESNRVDDSMVEVPPPDRGLLLLTPARYEPTTQNAEKPTPQTAVRPRAGLEFPHANLRPDSRQSDLEELSNMDQFRPRTGSKSRKPDGLSINLAPTVSEYSATRPPTGQTFTTTQIDTDSELTSPLRTGDTLDSRGKSATASLSGRNIDHYISSLEQAHYYSKHSRSRETSASKMTGSRGTTRRGSDAQDHRTPNPAKKSPSSPIPMSPEDLRMYTQSVDSMTTSYTSSAPGGNRIGTPASRSRLGKHQIRANNDDSRRKRSHSAKARGEQRHASQMGAVVTGLIALETAAGKEKPRPSRAGNSTGHEAVKPTSPKAIYRGEAALAPVTEDIEKTKPLISTNLSLDAEVQSASSNNREPRSRRRELAKELAAAELEARRLSLARRPSAPNIPFPGQGAHGKSASESHAPPLYRHHTDDGFTRVQGESRLRRPSTPRAMQVDPATLNEARIDDLPEVLPSSTYQTPKIGHSKPSSRPGTSHSGRGHARTASKEQEEIRTAQEIAAALGQLPRHPAFNAGVARSRSNSRTRDRDYPRRDTSLPRGVSREPLHKSPPLHEEPPLIIDTRTANSGPPMVLPELQHLVSPPPPPPPPPAPPKDRPQLAIRTNTSEIASRTPLPPSANPRTDDGVVAGPSTLTVSGLNGVPRPASATAAGPAYGHRRGRSGNLGSESQLNGKIKNLFGKMRTPSQGRGDNARSPPQPQWQGGNVNGEADSSPYETNTGLGYSDRNLAAQVQ
ncbi:uncharacterized protein AB675_12056 [Cyphellophora attinorum]|uniref:Gem-associated protein 5 TPR domain-containing protein n=1 Tax=Cyphellophora attinorum TaxID=1664694 RepID=A0A0N0NKP5_9EURO|nr:uncharacterized protein AB675_12056 [Phialophora attinorum]KPI38391.1 hypothetical protein AB675_12056 [Phialophora attinorum]